MFALLLAASLTAAAPAKSTAALPWPSKTTTLKNGLSVTRVQFPSKGLVAYYSVVRVGSRNEVEKGHTGFAHFFEHVMFKGTKAWPEGTRDAMLAKAGFSENAFTSDDVTVYHINGPSSELEKLVTVEADRFRNLEFSEQTFQTEAKAVLGEYHKNAANPGLKIEEAVLGAAFKTHPYQHTTLGFYEDVQAMPSRYEYSKQFFKRWYTPDNVMIFIVGDFDDAKLMQWVETHYGPWSGTAADVKIPAEPEQKKAEEAKVVWKSPTLPRTALFWHSPATTLNGKEGGIQQVLSAYLAGPTSPLYKKMVLEQQLAEHLRPDWGDHRDPTLFGLAASLKEEKHRQAVVDAMLAAVKELQSGKVDKKRFADIKDNLRFGTLMGLETQDDVAGNLAYSAGVLGSPDAFEKRIAQTNAVTEKDLVDFAKKYLVDTNRTTLVFTVDVAGGGK